MPYRESFACLWCGRSYTARDPSDLEGWAQICPDCIGRAGDNGFLRFRLKTALAERAKVGASSSVATVPSSAPSGLLHEEMVDYYVARAAEYDDFYLRRGRYEHGPIHDMAWQVELDVATRWLDAQPIAGEIVELAAGTGWWSPLLAQKGELWAYDAAEPPLDRARDRLLAHGLRAHLHTRDAWTDPDRQVDVVFAGFWLSHVPRADLDAFLGLVRRWLKPGGRFLFIDSRRDQQAGAVVAPTREVAPGVQARTLNDGREFRIVKEYYEATELEEALQRAGFVEADVSTTDRFFLLGSAVAA
jgi:demethylmenaquinone methyltransferase/2-methoxy-6-polyprenyl-1,4-benzoquinol methylase